ncbi:hypothetical protein GIB67_040287 [Kingdonia uniflora]|uniref:Uncharacterized protein n=1 Tax=Kingdonia uniflora TaxID=39325 RepID=A0A7J7MV53_9MAGN|nr:hypothetical protein GIB67_040287 [Kingdonia uniflora]
MRITSCENRIEFLNHSYILDYNRCRCRLSYRLWLPARITSRENRIEFLGDDWRDNRRCNRLCIKIKII